MKLFNRKKARTESAPTVGSYPLKGLADILQEHDVIDVVENGGKPFLLVTDKNSSAKTVDLGSGITLAQQEAIGSVYREPSALARAAGAPVQQVPASVPSQRVRLDDLATPDYVSGRGPSAVNLNELGSSSPSPWTSFVRQEYNPDLVGVAGLKNYDMMRRNDGIVRGTLRSVKTPVLSARWFIEAKDKKKTADVNACNWVWDNLTNGMSISFTQVIIEALLMCDFGYYMFEIVWEDTPPTAEAPFGRLKVRKLAPRHPMDVKQWVYDANGGVDGAIFFPNDINGPDVYIPIEKLLVFTFDREAGDMAGISLLRSAYKHWYYKEQLYKIDAIQKERHGIGIPVIKLPPNFDDADLRTAEAIGRNLRTNERAHISLPFNWEISFAKLEGQVVNAIESIDMHDNAIRENILLQFMDASGNSSSDEQVLMFYKATRFIANIVCDSFNLYLIPRMIDANFSRVGYPKLKARRIGELQDWQKLSFAIRNLIGCGVIVPDDKLEDWMREEMDMPERDPETSREIVSLDANAPDEGDPNANGDTGNPRQRGGSAGLPRQKPTPTIGVGNSSGGRDGSGG